MAKILIAGDFAPRARVAKLIDEGRSEDIFEQVSPLTSRSDYSIVNLEAPVVEQTSVQPITKYGPNLKCSAKAIDALVNAGFNMVTLANNHFYDYGEEGVVDTLKACKLRHLDVVGGGVNINEASKILYKEIEGIRIAFINCCESEFSIATEHLGGSNPLNPLKQYYDIIGARRNSDKVIVIVHGGHELYQLPSPRMKEVYRFFVDAGADVVLNHHQHCYSGYEVYKGRPIFYGLGNFCFDITPTQVETLWNYGYMVELNIDGDTITFDIIPYNQCSNSPSVKILSPGAFSNELSILNEIIADDVELKLATNRYYETCAWYERSILEPYRGRVLNKLFSMNLLPKFVSGVKRYAMLNHIECESHREKLVFALKRKR